MTNSAAQSTTQTQQAPTTKDEWVAALVAEGAPQNIAQQAVDAWPSKGSQQP